VVITFGKQYSNNPSIISHQTSRYVCKHAVQYRRLYFDFKCVRLKNTLQRCCRKNFKVRIWKQRSLWKLLINTGSIDKRPRSGRPWTAYHRHASHYLKFQGILEFVNYYQSIASSMIFFHNQRYPEENNVPVRLLMYSQVG